MDSDKPFRVEPFLCRRFGAYEFFGSCLSIIFVCVADQREEGKVFKNPNNEKSLSRPGWETRGFNQNPQDKGKQKPLWYLKQQIFRERFHSDWRTRRNTTFTAGHSCESSCRCSFTSLGWMSSPSDIWGSDGV
jgi:hypothetical protein